MHPAWQHRCPDTRGVRRHVRPPLLAGCHIDLWPTAADWAVVDTTESASLFETRRRRPGRVLAAGERPTTGADIQRRCALSVADQFKADTTLVPPSLRTAHLPQLSCTAGCGQQVFLSAEVAGVQVLCSTNGAGKLLAVASARASTHHTLPSPLTSLPAVAVGHRFGWRRPSWFPRKTNHDRGASTTSRASVQSENTGPLAVRPRWLHDRDWPGGEKTELHQRQSRPARAECAVSSFVRFGDGRPPADTLSPRAV